MDVSVLIDTYCQAWSAPDHEQRDALLLQVWAEDATYTDPTAHARGAVELLAHIAKVTARRPGSRVIRTCQIDVHHGLAHGAQWRPTGTNFLRASTSPSFPPMDRKSKGSSDSSAP